MQRVSGLGEIGRYCFDTITGIGASTYDAARSSADVALSAADAVIAGDRLALALNRPPGHHAARAMFGGGTYFNNAAIAAQALRTAGLPRVAVLDVDFHHCNGTQDIFYERDDVLVASLHGSPDRTWPFFSGWPDERGLGSGDGANFNLLLPPHTEGDDYRRLLATALEALGAFDPAAIVVSLGFDTAAGDPSGDAGLSAEDFNAIAADIASLGRPLVIVIEGGYIVEQLAGNLNSFLDGAIVASR
jgi:acetoin utilization deacetylase AcuC-like enzyme